MNYGRIINLCCQHLTKSLVSPIDHTLLDGQARVVVILYEPVGAEGSGSAVTKLDGLLQSPLPDSLVQHILNVYEEFGRSLVIL